MVAAAVPGVVVLGTITLNRSVGGLNPLAVEVAARQGARIVWFPTVSAVNEQDEVLKAGAHEKVPVWVAFELSLREAGLACEPVPVVDDRGALLPEAHEVLEVVARHGLVLCTGHLGRDEIFRLVEAAAERGIRDIVVTHPEFPSQSIAPDDQVELAEHGRDHGARLHDPAHGQGRRGSASSRRLAPSGPRERCGRPTSARTRTRPSRTGSR